jgi:hypothetical protein
MYMMYIKYTRHLTSWLLSLYNMIKRIVSELERLFIYKHYSQFGHKYTHTHIQKKIKQAAWISTRGWYQASKGLKSKTLNVKFKSIHIALYLS